MNSEHLKKGEVVNVYGIAGCEKQNDPAGAEAA